MGLNRAVIVVGGEVAVEGGGGPRGDVMEERGEEEFVET
jgi:hypothetical protein